MIEREAWIFSSSVAESLPQSGIDIVLGEVSRYFGQGTATGLGNTQAGSDPGGDIIGLSRVRAKRALAERERVAGRWEYRSTPTSCKDSSRGC